MFVAGALQPRFQHINLLARSDLSYDLLAEAIATLVHTRIQTHGPYRVAGDRKLCFICNGNVKRMLNARPVRARTRARIRIEMHLFSFFKLSLNYAKPL